MSRAFSVDDILKRKYKLIQWDGNWYDAFGFVSVTGIWFIWGNSGNGKTSFIIQLMKALARFFKIVFVSLEEGSDFTVQKSYLTHNLTESRKRLVLIEDETIEEIEARMDKPKSPHVWIIDSFQYLGMNYKQYREFKCRHRNKLIIFISHADGKQPMGRSAKSVMFDATLKIFVEGYRAISKGRYIGDNGGVFVIWRDRAVKYWGEDVYKVEN
jgi:hypothetical protein